LKLSMKKINNQRAFTLIELSISLVVMGLLLTAVIAGRELINVSKLKSVISEVESYKVAVDNFQTQYNALPGDMPNATSFWTTAQNSEINVQNGNGDGKIWADKTESYYAWNHLTLAKFVPGTFSGSSSYWAYAGVNMPASKYIENLGFGLDYFEHPWEYSKTLGSSMSANYLFMGLATNSGLVAYPDGRAFSPPDASYIDQKIDDGFPSSGNVLAGSGGLGVCTSGTAPNIVYILSTTNLECFMAVRIQ